MEEKEEGARRKNSKETRAHLEAMVLTRKPDALDLSSAAIGRGRFRARPIGDQENPCLVKEVNLAKNAEEKSAENVNRMCQVTLEAF